jgi:hypothetical protein
MILTPVVAEIVGDTTLERNGEDGPLINLGLGFAIPSLMIVIGTYLFRAPTPVQEGHSSMGSLLKAAILTLAGSTSAIILGAVYRSNHPLRPIGELFGRSDPLYIFAGWELGLGILAFLIGIGLLVGGLVRPSVSRQGSLDTEIARKARGSADATSQPLSQRRCGACGSFNELDSGFCKACGHPL